MNEKATGYSLTRAWFDWSFESNDVKPIHSAIYLWIVELNNRLGWKQSFGLPSNETMEGLGIGNKNTYLTALRQLAEWGFIEIIKESKNQYSSSIISLCHIKNDTALHTALDTALIQQSTQHSNTIAHSTDTIDKQINQETRKQGNQESYSEPVVSGGENSGELPGTSSKSSQMKKEKNPPRVASAPPEIPSDWSNELVAAFDQWLQYKSERKEKYVPSGLQALVRKISKHPPEAVIWAIEDAMGKNYQGFFPENYRVPGRGGQPQRSNNEIIGTALKNILKQDAENGIDITGEIPASIVNLWT